MNVNKLLPTDFKLEPLWLLLVGGLLLLVTNAAFVFRVPQNSSLSNSVKTSAELLYCSDIDSSSCDAGVSLLKFEATTRGDEAIEKLKLSPSRTLHTKIQNINVDLNSSRKDNLGDSNYFIYLDADNNGRLDEKIDKKIARAVQTKKTIFFEDLNIELGRYKSNGRIARTTQLLIANKDRTPFGIVTKTNDEGELYSEPIIKSFDIESLNIAKGSESVEARTSFADLSMFDRAAEQRLDKNEFLEANSDLFESGDSAKDILWKSGQHVIDQTLIIPKGLKVSIGAGTEIQIAPQTSVLSYSPINIEGNKNSPVVIRNIPQMDNFGSFAMIGRVNNPEQVRVNYLQIKNGSEDEINGAYASGMLSIYRYNKVTILNSSIAGSSSDDGLNIKNSNVYLSGNTLENNSADAWDGDFVTGLAENNLFVNNGNDSLDFSGSDLRVMFNTVLDSGDKCTSVGEGTTILIKNNYFEGCNIGVEVKDASNATITQNYIAESTSYGLNSYVKKFFWGTPTTKYFSNILVNTKNINGLINEKQLGDNTLANSIKEAKKGADPWLKTVLQKTPKP